MRIRERHLFIAMSATSQLVTASHNAGVDYQSPAQKTHSCTALSFQVKWSGASFAGTFAVEASNDQATGLGRDQPTNFSAVELISGSAVVTSIAVSGIGQSPMLLKVVDPGAAFHRLTFVHGLASTGSLDSVTYIGQERFGG